MCRFLSFPGLLFYPRFFTGFQHYILQAVQTRKTYKCRIKSKPPRKSRNCRRVSAILGFLCPCFCCCKKKKSRRKCGQRKVKHKYSTDKECMLPGSRKKIKKRRVAKSASKKPKATQPQNEVSKRYSYTVCVDDIDKKKSILKRASQNNEPEVT